MNKEDDYKLTAQRLEALETELLYARHERHQRWHDEWMLSTLAMVSLLEARRRRSEELAELEASAHAVELEAVRARIAAARALVATSEAELKLATVVHR